MTWEDIQHEKTIDLISCIQCKDQDGYTALAGEAFIAFTIRFRIDIIDKCRKYGKSFKQDNEACDSIAEQTFERFYKYPFRFQSEECKGHSIDLCVRLYLYKIARRLFIDQYYKESSISPYNGSEEVVVEFPAMENLDLGEDELENLRVVEKVLDSLTSKHRIIYLTYMSYEHKGLKLPRVLLQKLREETELKQDSIRVYKKEVLDGIKAESKKQ